MMIYDWSRENVEKYGSRVAITLEDEHITYEKLELESNRLAGLLIKSGLKPGNRVGLFLEKTPKTLIAMLGISKAGGVYVPLDFNSSPERVTKIIKSCNPSLLFIDDHSIHHFQDLLHIDSELSHISWVWWSKEPVIYGDDTPPLFCFDDIKSQQNIFHGVVRDENTAAQILYTSGSAEEPKGVVITHKHIQTFITWAVQFFKMRAGERTSCHSPLHFDLSTFDIFGSFAAGSRLFLVPDDISLNAKKLSNFILDNHLNQWVSEPSALNYLATFKTIPAGGFPSLKRLIWCGEEFPIKALQYWMKNLPNVQFTNMYRPTEATLASSYYTIPEIPEDYSDFPIGNAGESENFLEKIPGYMIPQLWQEYEQQPQNGNGHITRRKLVDEFEG